MDAGQCKGLKRPSRGEEARVLTFLFEFSNTKERKLNFSLIKILQKISEAA